jgi:hypothetical protein
MTHEALMLPHRSWRRSTGTCSTIGAKLYAADIGPSLLADFEVRACPSLEGGLTSERSEKENMREVRAWIFRGLVLVATGLLLYSWFVPLWGLDIAMLRPDAVLVRPWGEELFLDKWAAQFNIPTMPDWW